MLPYRSFVKVSSTSQVSSREVYPFQQIRYSFLQKKKITKNTCLCVWFKIMYKVLLNINFWATSFASSWRPIYLSFFSPAA